LEHIPLRFIILLGLSY